MAPNIKAFGDLYYVAGSYEPGSNSGPLDDKGFLSTTFAYYDDGDNAHFGKSLKHKRFMTLQDFSSALNLVPAEDICPLLPEVEPLLTVAPDHLNLTPAAELKGTYYIKRPQVDSYDWYVEKDIVFAIPQELLEEAITLQHITNHEQHKNIVKYHGCRVRNGRVTGLVFDFYEDSLIYAVKENKPLDKERIINGLDSAIRHLHSIGLAHNDINPFNIMVDESSGEPILIDFGSTQKIGAQMTTSRGTPGWMEDGDDYEISKESHDIFALDKIRLWLDKPNFDETKG